ncbi:MAG: T9SS C-terminal target domain-containing protein [Calditrichaeota bacterium]|nr:MAG: T9SS C-terminal target domain-containing protein [Calditrichota bacterium]MBL1204625.1 T9SS C-terminal target domain-containing protein [Calditrichota bacterium]NOG44454.1 T9SS type A sorting domain-containing protein [Calditrichota bacterium]
MKNQKRNKIIIIPLFIFCIINFSSGQNVYINEFLASNVTTNAEILDYDDYSDWIEIYNAQDTSVDLSGYYLTDNLNEPTKHQIEEGTVIKSKGYLLFWADGMEPVDPYVSLQNLHLSFKLSNSGEEIGLYDPKGNQIDAITFGPQITDVSYGRRPDSLNIWNYFGEPTPEAANNTNGTLNTEKATIPLFSIPGGVFDNGKEVVLTNESPTATIHYTFDGSKPTSSSAEFDSWVTLNNTAVLRARVFDGDKLPGPIVTQSYIINEEPTLPVLSLAVFPGPMFGDEKGIYTNEIKKRVLPVSVDYFDKEGELGFTLDAGIRLSGQAAFHYAQKPLTISTEDRFGFEEINYKIFPSRENEKFTSIYLRNSGTPDVQYTMFRDGLQHSLVVNQFDLDMQAYQPAMTFINGDYYGIYNIREKLDADYLASHHGIDPGNIDYLEYDFGPTPIANEGDLTAYNKLIAYLNSHNLSNAENYNYIKTQIDVNEYINYLITEIFCNNTNWPNTNEKLWKERVENSKWRWVLLDLDFGFGTYDNYTYNALSIATSSFIFEKLLESTDFKNEFIQRFAIYLNTVFQEERVVHIFDSLKSKIETEIPRHIERWGEIPSYNTWKANVNVMQEFGSKRQKYQRQHILNFFGLTGTTEFTVNQTDLSAGKILLNNMIVPANYSGPHFMDAAITLKAIPIVGYKFKEWQGISNSSSDSIQVTLTDTSSITAVFEPSDDNVLPAVLDSDNTLTLSGSPYLVKGDLVISPNATLVLEEGTEIQMTENSSIFVYGNIIVNGSESNPVVIKPNNISGFSNWGALCIENATAPSQISHLVLKGSTKGSNLERHVGSISVNNSEIDMNYIRLENVAFPIYAQYSKVTLRNSILHSNHTSDLINVKYANATLIENNDFRGNTLFDTDAIDLDQVNGGIVRGNTIYNFTGFNSDGIDLGEGCKNILIEGNLIFNCTDKGISVGQASITNIKNNVIVNCAQGVGIKDDSSYAFIDRNTFYGNALAVASFEKNIGAGGGHADIVNSILSQSTKAPFWVDDLSVLNISYSLSDTEKMNGEGNIHSNPSFSNNFYLNSNSPAIDAGSPDTIDPDGTRADMGAKYYDGTEHEKLMITEIHYNPANGDGFEFIEIFNSGLTTVALQGFRLSGRIEFSFPVGSQITSGEYLIVANNASTYLDKVYQVFEWTGNSLPNTGADIRLLENERQVDIVSYSNKNDWVRQTDGKGPSLELRSLKMENLLNRNWRKSYVDGGTPGQKNSIQKVENIFINELLAENKSYNRDDNREYDDWIEIYNGSDQEADMGGFYLTDDLKNPTKYRITVIDPTSTIIEPGGYKLFWADKNVSQGPLHVDFKLNGNGEEIGLVRVIENDTIFIDQVSYKKQIADVSYGRKTDGGGEWVQLQLPTPDLPNAMPGLFEKGVLVVNSLASLNSKAVYDAFANRAFWGNYPITFWDVFEAPEDGYPASLPEEPAGVGYVPLDVLLQYSTVIWLGKNYFGVTVNKSNSEDFFKYVEYGGNLILLSRYGQEEYKGQLSQKMGIKWGNSGYVATQECISIDNKMTDMDLLRVQILNSVFNISLTNENSTLLFKETISFDEPKGIGAWTNPQYGGLYNENGAKIIYISGRPYWYDYNDLSSNIEYMLQHFLGESPVGIDGTETPAVIEKYELSQNYPNPFNPATTIKYALKNAGPVKLVVYDLLGREVKTLVDEKQKSGRYEVVFNAKDLSTGLYFFRIKAGSFEETKKMVLIK